MTDLQKTQFNLLQVFVELCERLELPYFLVRGSALGAVKYGGFIPWDDDVDIAMPRQAYEAFLEQAPALLPDHLFLQNYITDPAFPAIYSKLRSSNSAFIEKSAAHLPIHHGVFLDLFPLDGYPRNIQDQIALELRKRFCSLQIASAYRLERRWTGRLVTSVFRVFGCHRHTAKTVAAYTALISRWTYEDTELVCSHGSWQGMREYVLKEYYGSGTWACFQGLRVRIPEDYDAYLTQTYGSWRSDPPVEEQVGHHRCIVCDPTRPYTDYLTGC